MRIHGSSDVIKQGDRESTAEVLPEFLDSVEDRLSVEGRVMTRESEASEDIDHPIGL